MKLTSKSLFTVPLQVSLSKDLCPCCSQMVHLKLWLDFSFLFVSSTLFFNSSKWFQKCSHQSFYSEGSACVMWTAVDWTDRRSRTSARPSTELSRQLFQSSEVKSDRSASSVLWLALNQSVCQEQGARLVSWLCSSVRRRVLMKVLIPSATALRIDWWQQLPQRSIHMLVLTLKTPSWVDELIRLKCVLWVHEQESDLQLQGSKHCRTIQVHQSDRGPQTLPATEIYNHTHF